MDIGIHSSLQCLLYMQEAAASVGGIDIDRLKQSIPGLKAERVERAYRLAVKLYGGRLHPLSEGMTLLAHVAGVIEVLLPFCPDEDAIIACLLQHSLRCGCTGSALEAQFGKATREIVSRLHLLAHLNTDDWRKSIDDLRDMLVSVSDDVRVVLLTLCACCSLLEQLDCVSSAHRLRICREALQLYAPVAARLGIYALKYRIENGAFPVVYPTDAEHIDRQLQRSLLDQGGGFLDRVVGELATFLRQEKVTGDVTARQKHLYSIFQKML